MSCCIPLNKLNSKTINNYRSQQINLLIEQTKKIKCISGILMNDSLCHYLCIVIQYYWNSWFNNEDPNILIQKCKKNIWFIHDYLYQLFKQYIIPFLLESNQSNILLEKITQFNNYIYNENYDIELFNTLLLSIWNDLSYIEHKRFIKKYPILQFLFKICIINYIPTPIHIALCTQQKNYIVTLQLDCINSTYFQLTDLTTIKFKTKWLPM
jgi:hypothetical protein